MRKHYRMTLLLLTLCMAMFIHTAEAKQQNGVTDELFDNGWKFSLGDENNIFKPDFDDSSWQNVNLPHDWSIAFAPDKNALSGNDGGYLPTGTGWYRKHFVLDKKDKSWQIGEHRRVILLFEGIYERSLVFVNGHYVGGHPYGYTSFYMDITGLLQEGENLIAVRVDNSQQKNSRWYTGSGIYRHVRMLRMPCVGEEPYTISITTPDLNTVVVRTYLKNSSRLHSTEGTLSTTVDGQTLADNFRLEANASVTIEQAFHIESPRLWSPETPNLYVARQQIKSVVNDFLRTVEMPLQTYEHTFGIRTIEYSAGSGLLLNGKPIKLNGGCMHHDNGILGAAAFDKAEQRRVTLMKNAGFNAVRTSHNPPSPAFLDACDRQGLLVIDEAFDGWRTEKNAHDYHELFDQWAKQDIWAMVLRDRNHPSVFCWSIGNEIIERKSPEAVATARMLRDAVRDIDETRPVTSALAAWDSDWEIYDPLAAEHDIVGYNYMIHKAESDHRRVPSRVMMQTESYPRDAFSNWKGCAENVYRIGDFVWTAMDYIGESGIGRYWYDGDPAGEHWERPLFPWHASYCGDIDLTGWLKPIGHYRRLLWHETTGNSEKINDTYMAVREPDGYFGRSIHTGLWAVSPAWESWNWQGWEGKDITVEVYSKAPAVRLYLNNRLIGEKKVGIESEYKALFDVKYEPGELRAEPVFDGFTEDSASAGYTHNSVSLNTSGSPAGIRLSADKSMRADGQDLCFVSAEIIDETGNLCPMADNLLNFEVSGEANIIATGTADIKDTVSYVSPTRKAWHGRVLVVLRSTGKAGTVLLSVTGNGLKSQSLRIKSRKP